MKFGNDYSLFIRIVSVLGVKSPPSEGAAIDKHFSRDCYFFFLSINTWATALQHRTLHRSLPIMSDEIVWQVINQQFCSYKLK